MWLLLFLSQQDFLINIHTMKHVVKIMVLLVAISACWIGLLQTSIIPRSHTWLVSFWFKFITYTSWVFLFIIELYIYKKKRLVDSCACLFCLLYLSGIIVPYFLIHPSFPFISLYHWDAMVYWWLELAWWIFQLALKKHCYYNRYFTSVLLIL